MQILPGFFLHFSSNFAHLSHIHRPFLSFFLNFRPLIRKIHFSFWTILAIFDLPKDQNLFFESATLFCMCPLGVLMMDANSSSQGFVRMSHVKCIYK